MRERAVCGIRFSERKSSTFLWQVFSLDATLSLPPAMRCCTLVVFWHSTDIAGIMSLLPPDYQAEALVEAMPSKAPGGRETQAAKEKANAAKAETVERLWRMLPPSQRLRGIAASAVLERACKVVVGEDAKRAAEGGGEGGMEEGGVGRGGEAGGQGACTEKPKTESGILVLKAEEAERVGEGAEIGV